MADERNRRGARTRSRAIARISAGIVAASIGLQGCDRETSWDDPIEGARKPDAVLQRQVDTQREAESSLERAGGLAPAAEDGLVLFGDLHVHSSYSWDGYVMSLPFAGGDGAHPPSDACDFARYCASVDFFALTDHAEGLLPEQWQETKESIRRCNALAGDPSDPDLVAFAGFEWSQQGGTPETHYGHRCVIFPETDDDRLPARPIGSADRSGSMTGLRDIVKRARWFAPQSWGRHTAFVDHLTRAAAEPLCPQGVPTRDLPLDCQEIAPTPRDLHAKLDEWGFDVLTIPHGTAWGVYTPASSSIDKHLAPEQYDAERMKLIEVASGHGNSEEYRSWSDVEVAPDGTRTCPEPTADYLPCCWQAGEIMRSRCGDLAPEECERRVELARSYAAQAQTRPHVVFPDAKPEEWLDCGQCRDCFKPSYGYRPRESVQYAMALSQEDPGSEGEERLRFRYGFVASSDGHTGRPGTGYKQVEPSMMMDTRGTPAFPFAYLTSVFGGGKMDDPRQPQSPKQVTVGFQGNDERVTSFMYPGGLAAVHARDRSREAIWDAFQRREVYGTSGPRILLWFDLLNGPEGRAPMGSELALAENPRFEVRAVGSFEQKPGCPETSLGGLSAQRLARLCRGECYHPGDRRRAIASIEVIRIRPQQRDGEAIDPLIEDPWKVLSCEPDPVGCVARFEDPEFVTSGRDVLYYVRALEEPSMALSGDPLATRFDDAGNAISVDLCTASDVDAGGCLAPVQERAWSSPIFVDRAHPIE
jgi:hypothetical protein